MDYDKYVSKNVVFVSLCQEFITCAVYTLFFMICGIVAAVKAQNHSSIGAAAVSKFT